MKKILSFVLAVVALAFSGFVFANSAAATSSNVDLSPLSPAQKQAILDQIDAAKKATTPAPASDTALTKAQEVADTAGKWAEIGHAVGSTLVSTARDLGVTANQFASTPVGKIVVAIVVWKYLASDLIHIATHLLLGIAFLVGGITLALYFLRSASLRKVESEEWTPIPVFWGLFVRQKLVSRKYVLKESLTDSDQWRQAIGYLTMVFSVIISLCLCLN